MKTINAFKITAKIEGKSWEQRGTTLTESNETEAKEKAVKILSLKPEHIIEITPIEVYESGAKLTTNDYPYGRLRATAFFNVEETKNGFREVFQTINPKDGRENKPKKSTYYSMILPCKHNNGHLSFCGHTSFNGTEEINRGLYFLNDFFELFTIEQIKNISITIVAMMKINAKAQMIYCGTEWEQLKPLVEEQIKTAVEIAKTGENKFLKCLIDYAKVEELKKPDFQPFKVTSYGI